MRHNGSDEHTVPSSNAVDISSWKNKLGLDWSIGRSSVSVVGQCGKYSIFRLGSLWMLLYFHNIDHESIPVLTKGFPEINDAVEELYDMERQVILDLIIKKETVAIPNH